jgi:predicted Ser/Thr protein kinase
MTGPVLRDKGGFLSPVIRLVPYRGGQAVLKDFRSRNALTRTLLAPVLVRREFAILRRLEGIPGIPRAYEVVDGRALLIEYVPGRTLGKFRPGELPDAVFRSLEETLDAVHRRDVVHLDLRQKKNVLIADRDRRPHLIDFANAARVDGALRVLAGGLRSVDRGGLLKFKARFFPHLLTAPDRAALKRQASLRKYWIFSPHTVRERDVVW